LSFIKNFQRLQKMNIIIHLGHLLGVRVAQSVWWLGYRLDTQDSVSGRGKEDFFLFTTSSRPAPGPTQPCIQCVSGALSLGVKLPGCEADHSPPSVKNVWSCTSTPLYIFMVKGKKAKLSLCLTKHHAMKAYWGSGGVAPCILNFRTTCRWVISFTPQPLYTQGKNTQYPLDRRLGGPQSWSIHSGEETFPVPVVLN
jgi:hypothetical protein